MGKSKKVSTLPLAQKMSKVEQVKLAKKLEVLIEKNAGSHYKFEHSGTDMLVKLKITTSEEKYATQAGKFLEQYNLVFLSNKKNHGSGMKTTILINIPKMSPESKAKIEDDFNKITTALVKKKKVVDAPESEKAPEQAQKEEVSLLPKKIRRAKKECPHYAYSRYLSKVLSFEGYSFKELSLKHADKIFQISCEDAEMIKIIAEATDYYFGKKISCVLAGNKGICLSFEEAGEESAQSQKYYFCYSPIEIEEKDIERRLKRVLKSNKYRLETDGPFVCVKFKSSKAEELIFSLMEMNWNIKESEGGFTVLPRFYKAPPVSDLLDKSISEVHEKVDKEDEKDLIFQKLCELIESEDFNLLDDLLKERILQKKEDHLKFKRREEVTAYAENLLAILD
ncbi:MAG: hypothetical protein EOM85_02755 [Candidatus Moranbacteria bacterium]|nr:hypothetical protein [Candidatus Moranbacteria bacterium]